MSAEERCNHGAAGSNDAHLICGLWNNYIAAECRQLNAYGYGVQPAGVTRGVPGCEVEAFIRAATAPWFHLPKLKAGATNLTWADWAVVCWVTVLSINQHRTCSRRRIYEQVRATCIRYALDEELLHSTSVARGKKHVAGVDFVRERCRWCRERGGDRYQKGPC